METEVMLVGVLLSLGQGAVGLHREANRTFSVLFGALSVLFFFARLSIASKTKGEPPDLQQLAARAHAEAGCGKALRRTLPLRAPGLR